MVVQECSEQPVRSKRHSAAVHQQSVRPERHSAAVPRHRKRILAEAMVHRGRGLPPTDLLRRNPDFPQTVFFLNRDLSQVRSAQGNVPILPPPSYNPFRQDMSVTLVTHSLISPRSRMFTLVISFQRVGQIWFVQILCRPKMVSPWKDRAR